MFENDPASLSEPRRIGETPHLPDVVIGDVSDEIRNRQIERQRLDDELSDLEARLAALFDERNKHGSSPELEAQIAASRDSLLAAQADDYELRPDTPGNQAGE